MSGVFINTYSPNCRNVAELRYGSSSSMDGTLRDAPTAQDDKTLVEAFKTQATQAANLL